MKPEEVLERADEAAAVLADELGCRPTLAVVLGTGWDKLDDDYRTMREVEFARVPGFGPVSAPGHRGNVRLVETVGGQVLVQEGRMHCYEGYSSLEASFPVWALAALGVKSLVLLAAAGGLNPVYMPGDFMLVSDHISLFGDNPLKGVPQPDGCERFVCGAQFYPDSVQEAIEAALPPGARVERGTYVHTTGPSFETNAEAGMLRLLGGDAVGMSITAETIVAGFLGMKAGALCCVSNVLLPFKSAGESADAVLSLVRDSVAGLGDFLGKLAASAGMIG